MTDEHEYEYAKYLAWERDALNRLYYALWIVFLGGFVYSFHLPASRHPCIVLWTVVVFRLLAVAGTGINFLMQYHAIGSLGHIRTMLLKKAQGDADEARRQELKARRSDRILLRCEVPLQVIAGGYLLAGLGLSFLVYTP